MTGAFKLDHISNLFSQFCCLILATIWRIHTVEPTLLPQSDSNEQSEKGIVETEEGFSAHGPFKPDYLQTDEPILFPDFPTFIAAA